MFLISYDFIFFFFNDTATTEIYTLSLHDALPIFGSDPDRRRDAQPPLLVLRRVRVFDLLLDVLRSEEHTSELQSLAYLVCRLLLEKKKKVLKNSQCTKMYICPPTLRSKSGR